MTPEQQIAMQEQLLKLTLRNTKLYFYGVICHIVANVVFVVAIIKYLNT